MMRSVGFGFMLLTVLSCGSDGGDAPEKCDALVTRMCMRLIMCINDGTTQVECESVAKTSLPCAQADQVSDGYQSCMSELNSSPCSVLTAGGRLNLPATCNMSILFR